MNFRKKFSIKQLNHRDFMKRFQILILFLSFLLLLPSSSSFAYDRESRLYPLNQLNVKKNMSRLRTTNRCMGCYLVGANFSREDLSRANLRNANLQRANLFLANLEGVDFAGADLTRVTWVNGKICQAGSIGTCVFETTQ